MKEALELFQALNKEDVEWIFANGKEHQVISGQLITEEGKYPDSLTIVLNGLLDVHVATVGDSAIGSLGPGEFIGEISYLEMLPASATVVAKENSCLLSVSYKDLDAVLEENKGFAARFFKAIAIINTRRLKDRVGVLGRMLKNKPLAEESTNNIWQEVASLLDTFSALIQKADKEAISNDGIVPEDLEQQIKDYFSVLWNYMGDTMGDRSSIPEATKQEIGKRIQRSVLPYMLLTNIAERMYSKPRGYAGDYLTIEMLYSNTPEGTGRIGKVLDKIFLDTPPARAVRNRRGLLAEEIIRTVNEKKGASPTKIISLASGPAKEVFDVYDQLDDPNVLDTTMVDIDFQALAYVSTIAEQKKLTRKIRLVRGNLVYLATGRQQLNVSEVDLVYSIGLIDYFSDKFVVALLDYAYNLLKKGGRVILGNFHSSNKPKAFLDHVLEWKLIHRDEEDMNRLFKQSLFKTPCTNFRMESEGINLFAEGTKI